MVSDQIIITVITVILGPIIVLYISNRIKNMKPKAERIDTAFDMYEAILKSQKAELDRKDEIIARKDQIIEQRDHEIAELREQLSGRGAA